VSDRRAAHSKSPSSSANEEAHREQQGAHAGRERRPHVDGNEHLEEIEA
jgi:hypothetical protein